VAVTVVQVPWLHPDAVALRDAMAGEMAVRYVDRMTGDGIPPALRVADDDVTWTGLAVDSDGRPVGHAAMRWLDGDLEIKRVYVPPSARGTGVAKALLAAAERTARALGAARVVLQTGDRQPDAVRLYEKTGYTPVPVFPPYDTLPFSLCFAKDVTTAAVTTPVITTPGPAGTTPHPC
jgi:GNAT superfamily N-acetyltransferase